MRPVTGSGVDHVLGRQEEHHERHGLDKAEFEPPEDQVQSHSADFDHEKERECSSLERMKEGPGQDVERRVPDQAVRVSKRAVRGEVHDGRRRIRQVRDAPVPVLENAVDEVGIEPITRACDREGSGRPLKHTSQVRGRRSQQDRATGEGIRDAHHQPAQEYLPTAPFGSMTYSAVEMKRSAPMVAGIPMARPMARSSVESLGASRGLVVSEFSKHIVITCDRTSAADGTTIVCRGGCGRPQMSVTQTVPRVYHSGDVTDGPCTQNRSPQSSNLHGFARYVSQRASDSSETGQRGERPAH